ncbi:hypothetical protein C8A05DRAFT_20103, partial [Staphylotrichum tortipilum]
MGKKGKVLSWFWIAGFSLLSLSANIASLVGGITPRTADLCLYRVKVAVLAEGLQKLAVEDGGQPGASLLHPDLPVYWYWGMSGICDTYASKSETRCRRHFPPTDDLLSIVEASVRDRSGGNPSGVVSAWNATLSSLNPSRLRDKHSKFVSLTKASAALVVLAAIFDVLSPLVGALIVFSSNKNHTAPYVLPFAAATFAIIAGALATCAMNEGVHRVVRTGEHGGPGIIMVFVGAALRFGSSTLGCCLCSGVGREKKQEDQEYRSQQQQQQDQQHRRQRQQQTHEAPDIEKTGFEGENHLNNYFADRINSWNPRHNWTSQLRENAHIAPFRGRQEDFADFTYDDRDGAMRRLLRAANAPVNPAWTSRTRFHIEAKATLGNGGADMFLRASQLQKVR